MTLRREMLEAVDQKLRSRSTDDLVWPTSMPQRDATPDEDGDDPSSMTPYWSFLEAKYRSEIADPNYGSAGLVAEFPGNWKVITISVTEDKNTMFLTRQRQGR